MRIRPGDGDVDDLLGTSEMPRSALESACDEFHKRCAVSRDPPSEDSDNSESRTQLPRRVACNSDRFGCGSGRRVEGLHELKVGDGVALHLGDYTCSQR